MAVLHFNPVSLLLILLLVNTVEGNWRGKYRKFRSDQGRKAKSALTKMQKDFDWSEIFDYNVDYLETHFLITETNMLTGLFEEWEAGTPNNNRDMNDLDDLMNQVRDLHGNLERIYTAHTQLEKKMKDVLRERSETMDVQYMINDLNSMSSKLTYMSGALSSLSDRAEKIHHKSQDVTRQIGDAIDSVQ
ncbi:uncharacterized protein [Argopecten irradians]|uniref:uncharacterized protein n=1 Tax=Argopecten irradians TaxID=31199 RepID=UPI00371D8336